MAKLGKIAAEIKHRKSPNDVWSTPPDLAKKLISYVPIKKQDFVCDAFAGKVGNQPFFENYPASWKNSWLEIEEGRNAFNSNMLHDWIITNPPFSIITRVLEYSSWSCKKGFAYILPNLSLTNKRIQLMESRGFYITKMVSFDNPKEWGNLGFPHMFVIWEKRHKSKKLFISIKRNKFRQKTLEGYYESKN